MNKQTFTSHSPEETHDIAHELVKAIDSSAVIALYGDLGSGKTCFVQGIAAAININQPVTSPTFTVINEYKGDKSLYHIDLYRLNSPDEILFLGFEDYLESDGITAVEWSERAGDLFPSGTIFIKFESLPDPDHRKITIESNAKISIK